MSVNMAWSSFNSPWKPTQSLYRSLKDLASRDSRSNQHCDKLWLTLESDRDDTLMRTSRGQVDGLGVEVLPPVFS